MNSLLKRRQIAPIGIEHSLSPFSDFHQEINRVFNEFNKLFETNGLKLEQFENIKLSPSMDIIEDDNQFMVQIEMPGLDEKDIKVTISNDILNIHGEKTTSKKNEKKNYISREINYGSYDRSIALPLSADMSKVTSSFKKGMLWMTIPKKMDGKSQTRQIPVDKA